MRLRWPIVVVWLVVLVVGVWTSSRLSALQSNVFSVPGTDSEHVRSVLQKHFGDRSDGAFTVVFRVRDSSDPATRARLQGVLDRAAAVVPTGKGTALVAPPPGRALRERDHDSEPRQGQGPCGRSPSGRPEAGRRAGVRHRRGRDPERPRPGLQQGPAKGESIALPIALVVLLLVFGLSWAVTIPLLFAASTVFGTLSIVYVVARAFMTTPTYVTNLVFLIGLGIAIDYSLLIVYRFREELAHGLEVEAAVVRTMQTAGRAVIFSGATVAIGLALLLFMPLPFIRAIGIGGFLLPIVSILAAATLQPALLSIYGRRGTRRVPVAASPRRFQLPVRGGRSERRRAPFLGAARAVDHARGSSGT